MKFGQVRKDLAESRWRTGKCVVFKLKRSSDIYRKKIRKWISDCITTSRLKNSLCRLSDHHDAWPLQNPQEELEAHIVHTHENSRQSMMYTPASGSSTPQCVRNKLDAYSTKTRMSTSDYTQGFRWQLAEETTMRIICMKGNPNMEWTGKTTILRIMFKWIGHHK